MRFFKIYQMNCIQATLSKKRIVGFNLKVVAGNTVTYCVDLYRPFPSLPSSPPEPTPIKVSFLISLK